MSAVNTAIWPVTPAARGGHRLGYLPGRALPEVVLPARNDENLYPMIRTGPFE
jgi:hypothetical protein